MGHANVRRIVLIDHPFQLRLAGAFMALQVVLTGLFAAALHVFMRSELQAGLASAHASYRTLGQMLMPIILVLSGFNLLLSMVLVTLFVVFLTRRLARPLLRIRAVLEELGRRRFLDHTGIRPGDQLAELDQALTTAVGAVQGDFQVLREALAALGQAREEGRAEDERMQLELMARTLKAWNHRPGEGSLNL